MAREARNGKSRRNVILVPFSGIQNEERINIFNVIKAKIK
jgi:hypothetical protein